MAKSIRLGNPTNSTVDVAISTIACTLVAVQLNGGTDAASVAFHNDIDDTTGTKLYDLFAPFTAENASAARSVYVELPGDGIYFDTGIWANLTGTAATFWVWTR